MASVIQVFFLMLEDLAIQLVYEIVDGGIEIRLGVLGKKICTVNVDGCFGLL